jgi:hypothetical protein
MTAHFLQLLTGSLLFLWHPAYLTVLSDLLLPGHTFSSLLFPGCLQWKSAENRDFL